MNKSNYWLSSLVVLAASSIGAFGSISNAHADQMIEVVAAKAASGVQVSIGQCPCFRWTIQASVGQAKIETNDILISIDALVKYAQTRHFDTQSAPSSSMVTIGASSLLIKEAHVGAGFTGLVLGSDSDMGYSDIVRAGFYALVNIVQNDSMRLDVRSGYEYEKVKTMQGLQASHQNFDQAAVLSFESGPFSGNVNAHIGIDPDHAFGANSIRYSSGAAARIRVVSFSDFELGLSGAVDAEHDPFRELLGLKADNFKGMVLMDLALVERDRSN
jgi:hypothetical protein